MATLWGEVEDHSLVAELVRSGDLTRDQAAEHPQKNLITRALGADEKVDVDTTVLPIQAGDRVLLCSDGLSDMVPETRISELLIEYPDDPEGAARSLVSAALDAGGNDNITVVVVDVRSGPRPRAARGGARSARRDDRRRTFGKDRGWSYVHKRCPEPPPAASQDRAPQGASERIPKGARKARQGACDRPGSRDRAAYRPTFWGSSRYFIAFDQGRW